MYKKICMEDPLSYSHFVGTEMRELVMRKLIHFGMYLSEGEMHTDF